MADYFVEELKPIALPEQRLILRTVEEEIGSYEVVYVEPLPYLVLDFGTIAAKSFARSPRTTNLIAVEEDKIDATKVLELPENGLAQWRMKILDDIEVKLFQPLATPRWVLKAVSLTIDKRLHQVNLPLNLTQFFQFENRSIGFKVRNPTEKEINLSRMVLYGWRFYLKPIPRPAPPYTIIPLGGRE